MKNVCFFEHDALGSVAVVMDAAANVVERLDFEPFGDRVDLSGAPLSVTDAAVVVGFAGHSHDDAIDLINMGGRIYDPSLRRFLTPDPIRTDPLLSQGHNPYVYGLANPLRFVDPSGLSAPKSGSR